MYIDDRCGQVLLVGEANFSFSLSLAKYIDPTRITTTCYETREQLELTHGVDLIRSNLSLLRQLNFKSVKFAVDATKLDERFRGEKFDRLYFMFPHVSGRSNLKKNRELMSKFFGSCRSVVSECVFVALAAGQGGTSFEHNPTKRANKDSWTINQIAQQNGFILTACETFDPELFDCYKSTGFRSQSKSFSTRNALVHKFEHSLVVETRDIYRINFPGVIHPLLHLRNLIAGCLSDRPNIIHDIDSQLGLQKGSDVKQVIGVLENAGLLTPRVLNAYGGLVFRGDSISYLDGENHEIDNLKYDIVLYQTDMDENLRNKYSNRIVGVLNGHNYLRIIDSPTQFICVIDASGFLKSAFNLSDARVLFSDDPRTLVRENFSINGLEFEWVCRPLCIETTKWEHDLSFWANIKDVFDYDLFIKSILETCFGLIRFVRLLDVFDDEANGRRSLCFRLVYESCDRAVDWESSKLAQSRLRDRLTVVNGLTMR